MKNENYENISAWVNGSISPEEAGKLVGGEIMEKEKKTKWFILAVIATAIAAFFVFWYLNIQQKNLDLRKEKLEFDMKEEKIKNRRFPGRLPWE